MVDTIALDDIRNLPAALMQAIRAGTWQSPNAGDVRILARVTREAMDLSDAPWPALTLLASQARNDLPVPNQGWTPEMRAISDMIWPYLASSTGLNPCVAQARGTARVRDIPHAIEIMRAHIADRREAIAITEEEASTILRSELERVDALHPELGLSFGYIGNIWWGPYKDDRSFRYFTRIANSDDRSGSLHFGDYDKASLHEFAFKVRRGALERWAADASEKLKTGRCVARFSAQRTAA